MDASRDAEGDHHAEPVAVDRSPGMIVDPAPRDEVGYVCDHEEDDVGNYDSVSGLIYEQVACTITGQGSTVKEFDREPLVFTRNFTLFLLLFKLAVTDAGWG